MTASDYVPDPILRLHPKGRPQMSNEGDLVEVVTLNDLTLISFGKCKPAL